MHNILQDNVWLVLRAICYYMLTGIQGFGFYLILYIYGAC